jgi:hypothetical protein
MLLRDVAAVAADAARTISIAVLGALGEAAGCCREVDVCCWGSVAAAAAGVGLAGDVLLLTRLVERGWLLVSCKQNQQHHGDFKAQSSATGQQQQTAYARLVC